MREIFSLVTISVFKYPTTCTSDDMNLQELLLSFHTCVKNEQKKIIILGASDMKAGLSHMIVIICMSMYYYTLFIIVSH